MTDQTSQKTKDWAAEHFGIKAEDVLWYNSGICYSRIGVKTKKAADQVSKKVKGESVNGGMLHGMPLGGQSGQRGNWEVTC